MIFSEFHIFKYSLPFVHPLRMPNTTLTSRDGLLLQLLTKDGLQAYGDIPPFPGLSEESIELAYIQTKDICRSLKGRENPLDNLKRDETATLFPGVFASVAFGIESAFLDLASQSAGQSIATFLSHSVHQHIKTNGLLTGSSDDITKNAKQLVDAGYSTIKIKVGRQKINDDIKMLHHVSDVIGSDIRLRLDANRAWKYDEAVMLGKNISDLNIEYIEEPLTDFTQLEHFFDETHVHIALDESLFDFIENPPSGTSAFIFKPGIHGGVFETINLVKQAQAQGITPVISSAFLSAVGLNTAASLAAAFTSPNDVMGLDTSSRLQDDFLSEPISVIDGCINILKLNQSLSTSLQNLIKLC